MNKKEIRVLVVEDNPIFRSEYCRIVHKYGYDVATDCGDGYSTKEVVETYQPHLILMDTKLIGITGLEICASIRKTEQGKRIGIIGMSQGSYGKEWEEAGADAFLDKMFLSQALESTLEEVLRKYYPEYNPEK